MLNFVLFVGHDDVDAMRLAGAPKNYSVTKNPLLTLVHELIQRKSCNQIYLRKPGLCVALEKRSSAQS
ncbi:MAG TPA: hypothetical protein VLA17_13930 [Candidatus Limnocylindria bacterium]|nr:hypothetical protein [Candidatus Limnocylindria bacterium]